MSAKKRRINAVSKYGVLDFLLESLIYEDEINIDEYLYTVSEYRHVSQQNIEGMKMVLPVLKNYQTPFTLVNCKVPANESVAAEEKNIYIEGSYNAMKLCNEQYENEEVLIDDTSADHYPMDVFYSDSLEVIGSTEQLMKAYEEQAANYRQLVTVLEENLEDGSENEAEDELQTEEKSDNQAEIIKAFSEIMNDMETPAAEDEFLDENKQNG